MTVYRILNRSFVSLRLIVCSNNMKPTESLIVYPCNGGNRLKIGLSSSEL